VGWLLNSVAEIKLVGVVTAPRVFEVSYATTPIVNMRFSDLAALATDFGVPSLTMHRSLNEPGLLEIVKSWQPDMFLVAGWYQTVPRDWLEFAPAYGLHASLLPDYRGGAPLVWAIINGEEETGITFFS
jgi:methionyl-tRNA formyltransferase